MNVLEIEEPEEFTQTSWPDPELIGDLDGLTTIHKSFSRIPQIGDMLEVNFGFNPDLTMKRYNDDWVKYWNNPIQDEEQRAMAEEIIKTGGLSVVYSRAHFRREFRAVPNILEELTV